MSITSDSAKKARADVDLRSRLPAVYDQGPRPVCVPISVTGAHDNVCFDLSEDPRAAEALWHACHASGEAEPAGTTLNAVTDKAANVGQPSAADWPFNVSLGFGTEQPPSACKAPWRTQTFREIKLAHDGREDGIENELAAARCVVLIVEVTDEFAVPDQTGIVSVPDLRAAVGDYHAVLVVGAMAAPSGERCLLVRNSWGPRWGLGGYCLLPIAYLEHFGLQAASPVREVKSAMP